MSLIKMVVAWIRMVRPPILFLCSFGALVSALNCAVYQGVSLSIVQIFFIILVPALLSTGTMIHNDVTDLESDKVNRPYKPVPSGIIKEKTAYMTGIVLMFLSVIFSLLINYVDYGTINWNCGILTTILLVISLYYNYYGKYHGIFGHMAVAFGVGAIPYWGSISAFPNSPLLMLPLAIAIFFQETGREIMVCTGDYNGDVKAGFKTTPVRWGRKKAMLIGLPFYLLFIPFYVLSVYDWIGLGFPKVFGIIYLIGGGLLAITLIVTWILSYIPVLKGNEKEIWIAFERYERIGTRVMIIVFQIFIMVEIFI
ncbi:MAG: UbiA family prenyltransferase [Candidatus Thermoplasmatota archaeon]